MSRDPHDCDPMFEAIGAFLCRQREENERCAARGYWRRRPVITRDELALLAALMEAPLCAGAVAERLGRESAATCEWLGAMVAIGLLERRGEDYAATPVAAAYCQARSDGHLSGADIDSD